MTLQTETFELVAEADRLAADLDDLADRAVDEDGPAAQRVLQMGQETEKMLAGIEWAQQEFDADEVTLGGLTGGDVAKIEDEVGDGELGKSRVLTVAVGSVDAPWVGDEAAHSDERKRTVADLHIGLQQWAEKRISALTTAGNEERASFEELVRAKQSDSD